MKPVFKTKDVLKHFGDDVQVLATKLDCTRQAIYQWGEHTPKNRGYELLHLTKGKVPQVQKDKAA